MEALRNGIELTGTLYTSAQGDAKDKLAYAEQIWDDEQQKHQSEINKSKVDKEEGKQLSTEDFTSKLKAKLESLENYDDSLLTDDIQSLSITKADRQELSNVLAEQVIDPPLLDEIEFLTRERIKKDLFIDMWNAACGDYGKYDPDNAPDSEHPFFLNDLWLSYEEAVLVMYESQPNELMLAPLNGTFAYRQSRTLLPLRVRILYVDVAPVVTFIGCLNLEVIALDVQRFTDMFRITHFGERAFGSCQKLREVRGIFYMKTATANATSAFENCKALEEIRIKGLKADLSFVWCPKISLATLEYIVDNAENTSAITITVYPDVYAKLTGDTTNDAYNDLSDLEKIQWVTLVEQAANKNITFITSYGY